jgi:hypothetical protein
LRHCKGAPINALVKMKVRESDRTFQICDMKRISTKSTRMRSDELKLEIAQIGKED